MTGERRETAGARPEREWNERTGHHWVRHQDRYDRMLAPVTTRLMAAAKITASDAVLDIGCGCGTTSRLAADQAREGEVLGVDVSVPMLARARTLGAREGRTTPRFEHADVTAFPFAEGHYDVAISRFGVMFFEDPAAAFANIARALRPGGRLAFVCWQEMTKNEHFAVLFGALAAFSPPAESPQPPESPEEGAPGPFSLADPERIRAILGRAGFTDIEIEPLAERMVMGSDVPDVVGYLREHPAGVALVDAMDDATAARAMRAVETAMRPFETPDGVTVGSASWLVTARR